jgi:hypothetical protein
MAHIPKRFYVRLVLLQVSYELPTQNLPHNAHSFWNACSLTVNYFGLPQRKRNRHYLIHVTISQDGTSQYSGSSAQTLHFATTLFASTHHLQPVLATSLLPKLILMLPSHLFECSGRVKNTLHQFIKQTYIIIIIIIIKMLQFRGTEM